MRTLEIYDVDGGLVLKSRFNERDTKDIVVREVVSRYGIQEYRNTSEYTRFQLLAGGREISGATTLASIGDDERVTLVVPNDTNIRIDVEAWDGRIFTTIVPWDATMRDVKAKLAPQVGTPENELMLAGYTSRAIDGGHRGITSVDYKVRQFCSLDLAKTSQVWVNINIDQIDSRSWERRGLVGVRTNLYVAPTTTVRELKEQFFANRQGVSANGLKFSIDGQELQDEATVGSLRHRRITVTRVRFLESEEDSAPRLQHNSTRSYVSWPLSRPSQAKHLGGGVVIGAIAGVITGTAISGAAGYLVPGAATEAGIVFGISIPVEVILGLLLGAALYSRSNAAHSR